MLMIQLLATAISRCEATDLDYVISNVKSAFETAHEAAREVQQVMNAKKKRLAEKEEALKEREKKLNEREKKLNERETLVLEGAEHVQEGYAMQQAERRRKTRNLAAHSIGYCIKDSSEERYLKPAIDRVRSMSGLPNQLFVPGDEAARYPLVLIFHKYSTGRYHEALKAPSGRSEVVERCRRMVDTGGKLVVIMLRTGSDTAWSVDEHPPDTDALLLFGINMSFHGEPYQLMPDSVSPNKESVKQLQELVGDHVPVLPPEMPDCYFGKDSFLRRAVCGFFRVFQGPHGLKDEP
jgi:hypothetical protein